MKLGMIGLGAMGSAMAANILKAGHALHVWNRTHGRADALVADGAVWAEAPAALAGCDAVVTMLADDAAVAAVTFGPDGLLAGEGDAIHLSMSTIGVAMAERLAAAHPPGRYVSAPVFGRPPAAVAAELSVVAAGPAAAIDACGPVFDAVGRKLFRVGDAPAAANAVKLGGNFMILAAVEAMAEAMALVATQGVSRAQLLEVLTGTIFGAPVYANYGAILVEERFRPAGFPAPLGLKDMRLVGEVAEAGRVPMPLLGIIRDHLLGAIAREGEAVDWSGIATAVWAAGGRG